MKLYELTSDFTALMNCDTDDEITSALVEISAGEVATKVEGYCKFLASVEANIEMYKAEEKRLAENRKAMENKVKRAREYMRDALLSADILKLDAGTFKVSVSMTAGSLVIDDMAKIPASFKTITTSTTVDKNELKEAIKNGVDVGGCHIEANFALKIR